MQILHWLSKKAQEPLKIVENSRPLTKKQDIEDQKAKSKDIVNGVRRRRLKTVEQSKLSCENFSIFCFLQRKDISKACFYHTLNLRRTGSFHRRQMKTKKEVSNSTTHSGNKVLPITDSAQTSSRNSNHQCPDLDKKEKTKRVSRMKELVKWATASKGERGGKQKIGGKVLHYKDGTTLAAVRDKDQLTNESPKISFSCSMDSSTYFAISRTSSFKHDNVLNSTKTGNWITTDSEFVVLEL